MVDQSLPKEADYARFRAVSLRAAGIADIVNKIVEETATETAAKKLPVNQAIR